jgi:hypothetical protein
MALRSLMRHFRRMLPHESMLQPVRLSIFPSCGRVWRQVGTRYREKTQTQLSQPMTKVCVGTSTAVHKARA